MNRRSHSTPKGGGMLFAPRAIHLAFVAAGSLPFFPALRGAPALEPAAWPPPAPQMISPYAPGADHVWNRLHRALFVRTAPDGSQRVHEVDPLLYSGGTFLVHGDAQRQAVATLDEWLAAPLLDSP